MVERTGIAAKLQFKVHPHMLRHACGYALANKGHDTRAVQAYLGHRNIQHTAATLNYRLPGSSIFGARQIRLARFNSESRPRTVARYGS